MKYTSILIILFVSTFAEAQYLVEASFREKVTASEISDQFGIPASYDVISYKVLYNTVDAVGEPDVASGLVSFPVSDNDAFPLLAIQHGTVTDRSNVPSNLEGGYQFGLLFGGLGFVCTQADYIGLGVSQGIHPYVHADSEATAGRDLMRAAKELALLNFEYAVNDQVFITGYSQGGHGAMALHRALELNHPDEFKVTACAPMSGPYSISDKMIDFTLGDEDYLFTGYLAWVALSMKEAYPDELANFEIEDIFKAQYVDDINEFANETIDLNVLSQRLATGLQAEVGAVTPKDLMLPDILDAIKNDPTHPLSAALAKQDVYDWAPEAPTRLMGCIGDDQVTYENTILAEQVMNDNGAADVLAEEFGDNLDHGGCITPATTATVLFFITYWSVSTNTEDISLREEVMLVAQHEDRLNIMVDPALLQGDNLSVQLIDLSGQQMNRMQLHSDLELMNIGHVPEGLYVLQLIQDGAILDAEQLFIR